MKRSRSLTLIEIPLRRIPAGKILEKAHERKMSALKAFNAALNAFAREVHQSAPRKKG
jgi:hypothetical protein